ncbi:4Fe-4S binding protein [Clostridium sp. MB40-C1]|uniref:4Fe-4S binding protein n=1 Tax=Clostridium sp. MB40-C1 TaxID=3070996 RepID=UPI0027E1D176|nr:4Fe-4S binding protein [Clostridium sp. MB40-C1]WMJ79815.1 4Fe-4S binding protein [Clostridium sp. MB40-C1]
MQNILKNWKKYGYMLLIIFIVSGLFNRKIALVAVICMLGPIILALFNRGRFWCGNICPRGIFYDSLVAKYSPKKSVPRFFKSRIFRGIFIIFMFYVFGAGIYKNWGDINGIGMVFYRMIVVTTFVGIVLGLVFNHRTWCNFCPMGSIAAIISYFKKNRKSLIVKESCVSCKLCEKKCPMGIVPYDYKGDIIDHPDCIQCGKCVSACPKKCIIE